MCVCVCVCVRARLSSARGCNAGAVCSLFKSTATWQIRPLIWVQSPSPSPKPRVQGCITQMHALQHKICGTGWTPVFRCSAAKTRHAYPISRPQWHLWAPRQTPQRASTELKAEVLTEEEEVRIASSTSSNGNALVTPSWMWEDSRDAFTAYGVLVGILGFGSLPFMWDIKSIDLPYFIGLAVTTIYIGAHKGLTTKNRQQITMKEVCGGGGGDCHSRNLLNNQNHMVALF